MCRAGREQMPMANRQVDVFPRKVQQICARVLRVFQGYFGRSTVFKEPVDHYRQAFIADRYFDVLGDDGDGPCGADCGRSGRDA